MTDETAANRLEETKAQKFVRLAESRVTKVLAELRKVGNLAAPNYEYTEEQVKAIMLALNAAISDVGIRFSEPCSAEDEAFSFVDWVTIPETNGNGESLDDYETIIHNDQTG